MFSVFKARNSNKKSCNDFNRLFLRYERYERSQQSFHYTVSFLFLKIVKIPAE